MNKYQKIDNKRYLMLQYSPKEQEIIEIYQQVINKIAVFCNTLGTKNVSEIYNVFGILAHEGYLSHSQEIALKPSKTFDILGYEGADILIGKGNCRNFSNFLKLIYEKMGYESWIIANYLYDTEDANFNNVHRLIQRISRLNHACCLVEEDKIPYIFDSLNMESYIYKEPKHQIGKRGSKIKINYKWTYFFNTINQAQLNKIQNYPQMYQLLPEEKRILAESKVGTIRPIVFNELNNTDCMHQFYESIHYELTQAKKLAKI